MKFYDAENVRRVTKRLVLDRDVQAAQAAAVRKAMREQITSQRPTFSELQEQLGVTRLTQVLEVQSYEQSRQAHDAMGLRAQERLFGLSIIEQILAKYPTREARKQFAESVVPRPAPWPVLTLPKPATPQPTRIQGTSWVDPSRSSEPA